MQKIAQVAKAEKKYQTEVYFKQQIGKELRKSISAFYFYLNKYIPGILSLLNSKIVCLPWLKGKLKFLKSDFVYITKGTKPYKRHILTLCQYLLIEKWFSCAL